MKIINIKITKVPGHYFYKIFKHLRACPTFCKLLLKKLLNIFKFIYNFDCKFSAHVQLCM